VQSSLTQVETIKRKSVFGTSGSKTFCYISWKSTTENQWLKQNHAQRFSKKCFHWKTCVKL